MASLRILASSSLVLAACGGTVVFGEGGEGGAGEGGNGSALTSGPVTSVAVNASSANAGGGTSSSSISSANAGGSAPTSGVTTGAGGFDCGGRDYASCLGAGDACVPVFDDFCCSSCFPGGCADCIDLQFVACVPREPQGPKGGCGSVPCGFIPFWACEGFAPDCSEGCFGEAGCVDKVFCEGEGCSAFCEGIRPDACDPVACDGLPPDCFDGTIPEVGGGCWTGACIPAWVCAAPPF